MYFCILNPQYVKSRCSELQRGVASIFLPLAVRLTFRVVTPARIQGKRSSDECIHFV